MNTGKIVLDDHFIMFFFCALNEDEDEDEDEDEEGDGDRCKNIDNNHFTDGNGEDGSTTKRRIRFSLSQTATSSYHNQISTRPYVLYTAHF